jgi:S-adenosylmethionine synthetase
MIRFSEMVLAGHPDKFCDQVADAIVAAAARIEPESYCQVEVAAWCDQVWISGGLTLPEGADIDLAAIVDDVSCRIGYRDALRMPKRFKLTDTVCRFRDDPRNWSHAVNDQAICMGWAGYDEATRYLPPEHFLAHALRQSIEYSLRHGALCGNGPDGKLLLVMAEEGDSWRLEQVLLTLEQGQDREPVSLALAAESALAGGYESVRALDRRWAMDWASVRCLVNPNGPLVNAGTETDNGQTGRKLVMDYYGPRVGQGGGALSGKHLTHVDRLGAYAAREAAVEAVRSGARECKIILAYAPNIHEPLELACEMEGRGVTRGRSDFSHRVLRQRCSGFIIDDSWATGTHFWDEAAPWNAGQRCPPPPPPDHRG